MVVIDQEKVVKVASHFFCGIHDRVEVKFLPVGEGRKMFGQHVGLDLRGDGEFRKHTLFFRCDADDLPHIALHLFRHFRKGLRQYFDLIIREIDLLHLEDHVVAAHLGYPGGHPVDRPYQMICEQHRCKGGKCQKEEGDQDRPVYCPFRSSVGFGNIILQDSVRQARQKVGGSVQFSLGDHEKLSPPHSFDWGIGDISFFTVQFDQGKTGSAIQGFIDQGDQIRV